MISQLVNTDELAISETALVEPGAQMFSSFDELGAPQHPRVMLPLLTELLNELVAYVR